MSKTKNADRKSAKKGANASIKKAYKQGRKDMKRELLAAITLEFKRATGYDEHERENACSDCSVWYRAIDAAMEVKA